MSVGSGVGELTSCGSGAGVDVLACAGIGVSVGIGIVAGCVALAGCKVGTTVGSAFIEHPTTTAIKRSDDITQRELCHDSAIALKRTTEAQGEFKIILHLLF